MSPATAMQGGPAFTLTVNGALFTGQSVVKWGGSARTTSFVSTSQLTAQITAADIASAGSIDVTVVDGAAVSSPSTFVVTALPPLALSGLSPSSLPAGSADFHVAAIGTGFSSASVIAWNGTALPTTYLSSTLLRAAVSATRVAAPGTAQITVVNPAGQGGTSPARPLLITPATLDAVSFQLNPAHTGAVTFRNVALPAATLWSVNLGGTASYSLVVGQTVFVMASIGGNSQLFALNASTGATTWGPVQFAGTANAAYDSGLLYVVNGSGNGVQLLTALDPATGSARWSASVAGSWFAQPPVAAGGLVGALNAGVVTVLNGATGALLWNGSFGGTSGALAITPDGIYGSAPCTTVDLLPLDGTVLWSTNTGCSGGGGDTPVVANGVVYSPINGGYSGIAYDAETGAVVGSFSTTTLPAVTATTIYELSGGTLRALALSNNAVLWSFAGDGQLDTAPIVVGGYVFIGSFGGNLYALDASTGQQLWSQSFGVPINASADGSLSNYGGLAAGNGLLLVPAGNTVTAYLLSTNP